MYICPMHNDVKSDKPGICPKCGMALVKKGQKEETRLGNYFPLIVIIGLIFLAAFSLSLKDVQTVGFSLTSLISYFMIGFFLVFSGFKLMDLKGFADGYSTYDLLAKKWRGYGYLYPFLELFIAICMIFAFQEKVILLFEIILMAFSGIGVAIKMARKEKFQCACLGTFLKVPLTKVTLIEDFGMTILGIILLLST